MIEKLRGATVEDRGDRASPLAPLAPLDHTIDRAPLDQIAGINDLRAITSPESPGTREAKVPGMTIDLDKLAKLATITLTCEPEHVSIEGNALASGNADEDRAAERWVYDQLNRGNAWAWCTAVVRARYADLEGVDVLGGCSYLSEADFKQPGGYYDDMVDRALAELAEHLEAADVAIAEVRS